MKRSLAVLVLLVAAAGLTAWRLVDIKPNPNQQAVADGCQRDTTKIYTGFAPNWVYVNDKDYPASGPPPAPRWLSGVVASPESGALASRISSSDDPITHRSFDVNIDVKVDAPDDFLTGTSRDATREAGTIHMERETAVYPSWTMPAPGDRIVALGSWVWDCDHYQQVGEKTEFHPYRATWIVRSPSPHRAQLTNEGDLYVSTDATPAGAEAECAHQTKGSAGFKSCTHAAPDWLSVNGDYGFDLPAPATPCAHPNANVVDRGSVNQPSMGINWTGKAWHVYFKVDSVPQQRVVVVRQIFGTCGTAQPLEHLRLRFNQVLIRRAMDPSCAPDQPSCKYAGETTLLGQIAPAPGEWQLTWSVDGIWGRWPGTLLAKDGSTFAGRQSVDFWVPAGKPWTLVAEGRECDFGAVPSFDGPGHAIAPCPKTNEVGNASGDDYGGSLVARFTSAAASLGRHVTNASTAGSSCPPSNVHGCYQLTYTVRRIR